MAIVRYEPLNVWNQFQNELNRLFEKRFGEDNSSVETSQWMPMVDIKEEPNRFMILADVPGVDPKDIEVTMDRNILTIKGSRSSESESKGENYTRIERSYGSFHRRFTLPETANSEGITAQTKNGVLQVIIPKQEASKSRKINIKVDN